MARALNKSESFYGKAIIFISPPFFLLLCFKASNGNARHLIRGTGDRGRRRANFPLPPSLLGPIKNQNIKFPPPPKTACPQAGKNSAKITTACKDLSSRDLREYKRCYHRENFHTNLPFLHPPTTPTTLHISLRRKCKVAALASR